MIRIGPNGCDSMEFHETGLLRFKQKADMGIVHPLHKSTVGGRKDQDLVLVGNNNPVRKRKYIYSEHNDLCTFPELFLFLFVWLGFFVLFVFFWFMYSIQVVFQQGTTKLSVEKDKTSVVSDVGISFTDPRTQTTFFSTDFENHEFHLPKGVNVLSVKKASTERVCITLMISVTSDCSVAQCVEA